MKGAGWERLQDDVVNCKRMAEMGGEKGMPRAAESFKKMRKYGEVRGFRELP